MAGAAGNRVIGRTRELEQLNDHLDAQVHGQGNTIILSGEPGIGKSTLVDAFQHNLNSRHIKVLKGHASASSEQPFMIFSRAIDSEVDRPLFQEQEYASFLSLFAINHAGMLVSQATSMDEGLDADIFAGMLSAVQNFISDSIGQDETDASLGRLEYGNMKILIEHGPHLFLTGIIASAEHPEMKSTLRQALRSIEKEHGQTLESWAGRVSDMEPIQAMLEHLMESKFRVRRNISDIILENERIRIGDEILAILKKATNDQSLVLILEDLHWADESSLFIMNYLARNIRGLPIFILGTMRPNESPSLQETLEAMVDEEIVNEMKLQKFDIASTHDLIQSTCSPNDFPESLAQRLFQQSKGNPLFVLEMLKGMIADGSITKIQGKYSLLSESYHVPASLEELVNRRVSALDHDSMAMVEYVSCIGQSFDLPFASSNSLLQNPSHSLGNLVSAGILQRNGDSLDFGHAMFQSVIYSGINLRWKANYHRSLGEHLEAVHSDSLDQAIYELARHFSMTREFQKGYSYSIQAGEKAESAFAVEQAIGFYEAALDCSGRMESAGIEKDVIQVRERLGDLLALACQYQRAIDSYSLSRDSVAMPVEKAHFSRLLGIVYEKWGKYDDALADLESAENLLPEDEYFERGLILVLHSQIMSRRGDYAKAIQEANEGVSLLERCTGDEAVRGKAQALNNIGICHFKLRQTEDAFKVLDKALELSKEIADQQGMANAYHNIGNAFYGTKDIDGALRYFLMSLEMKEKVGDKLGVVAILNNIGVLYYIRAEMDKALEYHNKSLGMKRKIGDERGTGASLNNIGIVYLNMGQPEKALECFIDSLSIKVKTGEKHDLAIFHENICICQHELGRLEEARDNCAKSIGLAREVGDRIKQAEMELRMAAISLEQGRSEDVSAYTTSAEALIEELGNPELITWLLRQKGMNAADTGDWPEAERLFERSLSQAGDEDRVGMAKTKYEWACLLIDRGEKEQSRDMLEQADATFRDLAMLDWSKKCERALARL